MTLNALKQRRAEASQAYTALLNLHTAAATAGDSVRGFSDEEKAARAVAMKKVTDLDELIDAEVSRIEMDRNHVSGGRQPRIEVGADNRVDRPFASFGEQLAAVVAAGTPGGNADPRLFKAGPSGGSTGVSSDGGFLVQTDFSLALMQGVVEQSVLLPLCHQVEASENSDSLEAPYIKNTSRATGSRFGGVQVYRRKEAATVAAKDVELGKFELQLEDMMGLAYLTGRQIRDAAVMEQITTDAFTSESSYKIDDEIIRGNGVGQMTGILNSAAKVAQAKISGQTAATVKSGNISEMWTRMPARQKAGAVWLHNSEVSPQLDELSIVSGTSALEPRFVNYGPDGALRIKGKPVIELEQCEALGTEGDFILVNLKEYLVFFKGGPKSDTSMHVRFIYDEMTLRIIWPINGKSKWESAVTPYKGSLSKSPIVTLATRA